MCAAVRFESLGEIEAALWRELAVAARDTGHGWRTPVLATVDGGRADARTVVLREVEAPKHRLVIYTDERSAKVRQIGKRPEGMLVHWCASLSWQLRLSVRLETLSTGLAVSSRWARLRLSPAAQDYLSPLAPGSPLERPSLERSSREHFAMIVAHVQSVDWLELHEAGHRRARFDADGARWVAP
jgi:hypothetical protein